MKAGVLINAALPVLMQRVICMSCLCFILGAGMVVDWEQETGLLMTSGDVRIIRIWDTDREMKVQVTPACLSHSPFSPPRRRAMQWVTPCTAKASKTHLWRPDRFWSSCFPASESCYKINKNTRILSEHVKSFLEAAAVILGSVQQCVGRVRLWNPEAGPSIQIRFPIST